MSQPRLALVCLLSLLLAVEVNAQPAKTNKDAAAALFTAAEIFFQNEEYERALHAYTEAYQLSSFPDLLFNIGQCYRALHRHAEALRSYRDYLSAVPDSPIRREVEGWITDLTPLAAQEEPTSTSQPALDLPASLPSASAEAPAAPSLRRFSLPLGLSLGGLALASGAIIANNRILASGQINNASQYTRLALAVSADAAFLGAGVTLLLALRGRESTAAITRIDGGALLSLGFSGGLP